MKKLYRTEYLYTNGFHQHKYIGFKIPEADIHQYLLSLEQFLGTKKYNIFTEAQQDRDGNKYHATILTPQELRPIPSHKWEKYIGIDVTLNLLGLGHAKNKSSEAFYVAVVCDFADSIRTDLHLEPRDFHITLGFYPKDVYDRAKDKSTLLTV